MWITASKKQAGKVLFGTLCILGMAAGIAYAAPAHFTIIIGEPVGQVPRVDPEPTPAPQPSLLEPQRRPGGGSTSGRWFTYPSTQERSTRFKTIIGPFDVPNDVPKTIPIAVPTPTPSIPAPFLPQPAPPRVPEVPPVPQTLSQEHSPSETSEHNEREELLRIYETAPVDLSFINTPQEPTFVPDRSVEIGVVVEQIDVKSYGVFGTHPLLALSILVLLLSIVATRCSGRRTTKFI